MNTIVHYIGLDVHKESMAVAIAPQNDELRSFGVIGASLADVDKLVKKLAHPGTELRFGYDELP